MKRNTRMVGAVVAILAMTAPILMNVGSAEEPLALCGSGSTDDAADDPCDAIAAQNGPPPFDYGEGDIDWSGAARAAYHWNRNEGVMNVRTYAYDLGYSAIAYALLGNDYQMNTGDLLVPRSATVTVTGGYKGSTHCTEYLGSASTHMDLDVVIEEEGVEIDRRTILDLGCDQAAQNSFSRNIGVEFEPGKEYDVYVWTRCESGGAGVFDARCRFHDGYVSGNGVWLNQITKPNISPEVEMDSVPVREYDPDTRTTLGGRACDLDDRMWRFEIDPGDGSDPYIESAGNSVCRSESVQHQYPGPGTYTAELCGVDSDGASACETTIVSLTEPPCDIICTVFELLPI